MFGYARIHAFGLMPENTPPKESPLIRIRRTMHTRYARHYPLVCLMAWARVRIPWLALFTFSRLGGGLGLGGGLVWAVKPGFRVERFFVTYAIEVITKKNFFFSSFGPRLLHNYCIFYAKATRYWRDIRPAASPAIRTKHLQPATTTNPGESVWIY